MLLSTDNPAVARVIAAIQALIDRLGKIGSQGEPLDFAQSSLLYVDGMIHALAVVIGKDHYEIDRLSDLAIAAYSDAYNRIKAQTA